MHNDNKFLVLELEENGAKVKIASKLKTRTIDLSIYGQQVAKGQFIYLNEGVLQQVSQLSGVEVNNGKLSVRTKIVGAYDGQDEKCKGLVKTEFFLKVARGALATVENDNELIGQVVTIGFNTDQECWEVVTVHAKPASLRRTTGLIYTMSGEQSVRIYSPGWPVDFEMNCGDLDRYKILGKWFTFPVSDDCKTVKWEDVHETEQGIETLKIGDMVMLRLPCWLDRDSGTIRTESHEWVFDPYANLTRYFEQREDNAVEHAVLELSPLNSGTVRLMAHDKQSFMVEEKAAGGVTEKPESDEESVESVDEAAMLEDTNGEIEDLSKTVAEQQEMAREIYLSLTKCTNLSEDTRQELEEAFIHLTSYERYLYAESKSVGEALETLIMLRRGFEKYVDFIPKCNTALLRSQYMSLPKAGKAFLGKMKKF